MNRKERRAGGQRGPMGPIDLGPAGRLDVSGGCEHCDATTAVIRDPELPAITHIAIQHDEDCPEWLFRQAVGDTLSPAIADRIGL